MTRCSPLSPFFPDLPYTLIVVEAKRDDFLWGWGQCLAGMLTAQKLAADPHRAVDGISTPGQIWEFGKLVADRFVIDPQTVTIRDLNTVFRNVHFLFDQCCQQLSATAVTLETTS